VHYVGIDVQVRRGCPYYIIGDAAEWQGSGWLPLDPAGAASGLRRLAADLSPDGVAFGIDAPRTGLTTKRSWTWSGAKRRWLPANIGGAVGRHCEIAIKAYGLANPQWTLESTACVPWMQLGFTLFNALEHFEHVHEVFPSASYRQLAGEQVPPVGLVLRDAAPGPRDLLDALVAAYTVREYLGGRGVAVDGGDDLGTIILPRPLRAGGPEGALRWPGASEQPGI
jgi:hypothetical protein